MFKEVGSLAEDSRPTGPLPPGLDGLLSRVTGADKHKLVRTLGSVVNIDFADCVLVTSPKGGAEVSRRQKQLGQDQH